ncbi:hypothetical protein Ptr902_10398 [Pyrenophora tritici-repentis]|nr:hypothetical protein Ptr902_10398 [Pyrenophora tritici-repentis]
MPSRPGAFTSTARMRARKSRATKMTISRRAKPKRQQKASSWNNNSGEYRRLTLLPTDEAYFQTVLYTLHAHAADSLRYGYPVPYNHLFIDTLRLKLAAYLPGASLSEVCTHFCQHYGQIADPTRRFNPEYEASLDPEKLGPQYNWCLVIDDECLDSLQCAPEPTGPNPPEDLHPSFLASSAGYVFVKMLSAYHNTMEKPGVLASQGRGGMRRRRIEWNGWLMFSPVDIMRAFREADTGEFETLFEGEDELADHSDYSD